VADQPLDREYRWPSAALDEQTREMLR